MIEKIQGNRLAVLPEPPKALSPSGIAYPKPQYEEIISGEVIDVGTGMPGYPLGFSIGDTVYFRHSGAMPIKFGGMECIVIDVMDVFKRDHK